MTLVIFCVQVWPPPLFRLAPSTTLSGNWPENASTANGADWWRWKQQNATNYRAHKQTQFRPNSQLIRNIFYSRAQPSKVKYVWFEKEEKRDWCKLSFILFLSASFVFHKFSEQNNNDSDLPQSARIKTQFIKLAPSQLASQISLGDKFLPFAVPPAKIKRDMTECY